MKTQSKFLLASGLMLSLLVTPHLSFAQMKSGTAKPGLQCVHLDAIERAYLNSHITFNSLSPKLEERTIEQYIKRLDGAKIYLLKSDVDEIKKRVLSGVFKKIKDHNCEPLDAVQKLVISRVADRVKFATETLAKKDWKFDPKTELMLDPESRTFAKNKAESDKFQLRYIQFQVSNYLATGDSDTKVKIAGEPDEAQKETKKVSGAPTQASIDEAKGNVSRNYDRILKRLSETNKDDIYSGYLDSFARALDPHSSYFSSDYYEDFNIQMGLKLEGIGATLSSQDGFTVVEQLISGGAAKDSGLMQPQDRIVAVGQFNDKGDTEKLVNVVEMDLRDVVRLIRGPKGSKVQLTIMRRGAEGKERFNVILTRAQIKLEDDAASISYVDKEVDGQKKKIAVMNLPSFYSDSKQGGRSAASDMKVLLKEAREKKADALVLDLSNNGGGSLEDAVKIAGFFFKTGNVVKQSTHTPEDEILFKDKDSEVDWDGPAIILTSRISASASEIVAATLKDYQRAVIVGGDHTFGKGTVQSVMPIPTGLGALKVTVGMFYTPGGFSTQHRGVEADVMLPGMFSTDEIGEQFLDYSLPKSQVKPFLSEEAFVASGTGAWKKLEKPTLDYLRRQSEVRVAKNTEFQKIKVDLKKTKDRGKIIKLSDALKDTKEKKSEKDKKKEESKDQKVADYLKRADIQEASNVAMDLIAAQAKPALILSGKAHKDFSSHE
jgi:carboxyl-terminal processing protease